MSETSIIRLLATSELRSLETNEKAANLVAVHSQSYRKVAENLEMTSTSVFRAVRALKAGREPGKIGKPPIFSPALQVELAEVIRTLIQGQKGWFIQSFRKL